ncbi:MULTISPECIES: NAD(P)H-dependent oxidoreductase [unclassified Butyrivibrio]|uniref:NAD(P)H-dependent oxidoreductase n=1 Tax=unclassified Butyrivibrio TaxID=2639466 RepID=UPI0003B729A2
MKNVLILSASPRKEGNSDILCRQFEKGAKEAGHKTEMIATHIALDSFFLYN